MAKNLIFIILVAVTIFLVAYANMTEKQKEIVPEPIKDFVNTAVKTFGGGGGGSSGQEIKAASTIPPSDKIRAFYGYPSTPKSVIDKAVTNGINTLIVKYGDVDASNNDILNLAGYGNINFIPAINFNYVSSTKALYYNEDTKTLVDGIATPALNRAYWAKLTSKVKSIAQLNSDYNIKGIFIDFETYFDYPSASFVYSYNGSYDTETFGEFIIANNLQSINPPISEGERLTRYNWIKNNNLEDEYTSFVKAKAIELSRDLEREVHSVNPNFIIGFYPSPYWSNSRNRYAYPLFFDFYKGFGKVTLFATDTYGYGNNLGTLPVEWNNGVFTRRDNNEQYSLEYVSGALLRYYNPDKINLLTYLNDNTDGFWMFSLSTLYTTCTSLTLDNTMTNYYRLPTNCKNDLANPGCCINQWSASDIYWIANCCPSYESNVNEYWTAISSI